MLVTPSRHNDRSIMFELNEGIDACCLDLAVGQLMHLVHTTAGMDVYQACHINRRYHE